MYKYLRINWALTPLLVVALLAGCSPQETADEIVVPEAIAAPTATAPEKSIAVLPFTDLSELGDQEYFSDGLSDDLIDQLSMVPDLKVAGRESSFYYKDKNEVLSTVGASLGVAHILQGSVRKSGNQLRVSAQLVSADDGFNLWSRTFDRELADIFSIQAEIAEAVTTALSVTLGAGEFDRPGTTRNIDAYDAAIQALALHEQFTPASVYLAISSAEKAVQLDPAYGRGWVLLGLIYDESQMILGKDEAADFPALAMNAFDKARSVAPDMPELLLVAAAQMTLDRRYQEAEATYLQFFERFGTSSARANLEYAALLSTTGRIAESLPYFERARNLEPFASRYTYQLALHLMYTNRLDDMRVQVEHGLTLGNGEWLFHSLAWQAALHEGDLKRAAALIREFYAAEHDVTEATVSEAFMLDLAGILESNDFDASTEAILELIDSPSVSPYELTYIARVIALLGQPQVALDYWSGAELGPGIWDTYYSEMRKLPEFKSFVQERGLEAYWRASGNWADSCKPDADGFVCF